MGGALGTEVAWISPSSCEDPRIAWEGYLGVAEMLNADEEFGDGHGTQLRVFPGGRRCNLQGC